MPDVQVTQPKLNYVREARCAETFAIEAWAEQKTFEHLGLTS